MNFLEISFPERIFSWCIHIMIYVSTFQQNIRVFPNRFPVYNTFFNKILCVYSEYSYSRRENHTRIHFMACNSDGKSNFVFIGTFCIIVSIHFVSKFIVLNHTRHLNITSVNEIKCKTQLLNFIFLYIKTRIVYIHQLLSSG